MTHYNIYVRTVYTQFDYDLCIVYWYTPFAFRLRECTYSSCKDEERSQEKDLVSPEAADFISDGFLIYYFYSRCS